MIDMKKTFHKLVQYDAVNDTHFIGEFENMLTSAEIDATLWLADHLKAVH